MAAKNSGKRTTENSRSKSKRPAAKKSVVRGKNNSKTHGDNNRSLGVFVMLVGLIMALYLVVVYAGTFTGGFEFGQIVLRILGGLCNIAIAMLIVYLGLVMFMGKESKISGWRLAGWFFFFFAILGMLHIGHFPAGLKTFASVKTAFAAATSGAGGGICGLLSGCLAVLIPAAKARYIVLSAIAILGLMLGTDMKIFSFIANLFKDDDPEKKAQRVAKKQAKAEAKDLAKSEAKAQALVRAEAAALAADYEADQANEWPEQPEFLKDMPRQDIVRDGRPKDFLAPPLITDYSGKMFEEITDYDAVTVGDLLAQEDSCDPSFIQKVMPRVSSPKNINAVSQQDLEQFADQQTAETSPDFESNQAEQSPIENSYQAEEQYFVDETGNIAFVESKPEAPSSVPAPVPPTPQPPQPQPVVRAHTSVNSITKEYKLPPLNLLKGGINVKNPRMNKQIMDNSIALESALASFGVKTKVVEVVCGPSVIRYELQPAPGVKVSKIVNLADDIALALAAKGLRIEAPVPGKSVVGIEIAKAEINPVFFKDVLSSERFAKSESKLSIAFGVDINGNPVIGNLADMPHLLIAGATGSGKSVCMNTLICSILYKAKPNEVKIIMIDPKKVELASYNGLPHLGKPVVTDSKKAAGVLREVVNEMERRYTVFASAGVKNFSGFNDLPDVEKMPQIVVLIDELADLMMVASRDVEDAICRLAQMARAAGIHLVIATQRPSVDVITGLIKANVPSRIAFAVSSQIDSRTILDMGGAEKLLGKGDMLYFPIGNQKPVRVQGAFLSESEIQKLVEYCSSQAQQEFIELPSEEEANEGQSGGPEEDDELFLDACRQVITSGQASASSLQRRFRIGYNRAARLIETMEELHIISHPEGNKRTVLVGTQMFEDMFGSNKNGQSNNDYSNE